MAHLEHVRPQDVAQVSDELASVYGDAFCEPPWLEAEHEAQEFAERLLPGYVRAPGFRCVVARSGPNARCLGFALGFDRGISAALRAALTTAFGRDVAADWCDDCFQFVELAVIPSARGQGVGGRLHDALLADVTARTAILLSHRDATPAVTLYRSKGWNTLIDDYASELSDLPLLVLGRRLTGPW
ncbi:MAG TPA: GNAT family N-acetyltransferase [Candidatus Limnocylindrales bacterium]